MKTVIQHRVSVIIPSYNRAKFLENTLNSVWEQTYRPIELLVIDDGSTDQTATCVQEWITAHQATDFTAQYLYQINSGAQVARNNGITHSTGQYLQFLDSDDPLKPEKIQLQVQLMRQEHTPICIADYLIVDEKGTILERRQRNCSINHLLKHFRSVLSTTPLIDRTLLPESVLHWDETIPKLQDIAFFMRVFMVVNSKSYLNQDLVSWVQHTNNRITEHRKFDGKKYYERRVYWLILKSLVTFYRQNTSHIARSKTLAIMRMFCKLIVAGIGPGRFVKTLLAKFKSN